MSDAQERQERVVGRNRGSLLARLVDAVVFVFGIVLLFELLHFDSIRIGVVLSFWFSRSIGVGISGVRNALWSPSVKIGMDLI